MDLSGILDTSEQDISLDWWFPDRMYVTNLDDDNIASCVYIDYDQADFIYYGFDSDSIYYYYYYYCGASIP